MGGSRKPSGPRAPSGLATAGRALWAKVLADHELEAHELAVLELAARQADDVAALEALIEGGLLVKGAAGQDRLTPAVGEARMGRLAVAKLLAQLALPAEEADRPASETSKRAQHAATARWSQQRTVEARRHDLRLHRAGGDRGAP